jgi:hypothetical protein
MVRTAIPPRAACVDEHKPQVTACVSPSGGGADVGEIADAVTAGHHEVRVGCGWRILATAMAGEQVDVGGVAAAAGICCF